MSKFNSSQGFEKIKEILSQKGASVHFVGVGGISMFSLFNFTRLMGIRVSGSDKSHSERTKKLIDEGHFVKVPKNVEGAMSANLVVYSLAISENDEELKLAEELGIPTVSRAEYLGFLSLGYVNSIAVSGSHGKSTVSAMLTKILTDAHVFPSALLGANFKECDVPFIYGQNEFLVFEACEYKDSFLCFLPDVSVFLNLELDHTDYFKTFDDISRSFLSAMKRAKRLIVNKDDTALYSLAELSGVTHLTYGIESDADFIAVNLKNSGNGYSFFVKYGDKLLAEINLSVLGRFSVYNALAAFAAAYSLGISADIISNSLSHFSGIERRLEFIGKRKDGSPIIYDYAHHPSEIKSGILAVKESYKGKINVIFKPHTYTRTRDLFDDFVESLSLADSVFISEIDAIREEKINGIDSQKIADAIGDTTQALSDDEILNEIKDSDGAIIIMGAANLENIRTKILEKKY